eukprot:scpid106921/ scgid9281/ 
MLTGGKATHFSSSYTTRMFFYLVSAMHNAVMTATRKRNRDDQVVRRLTVNSDYNSHMGGVDKNDNDGECLLRPAQELQMVHENCIPYDRGSCAQCIYSIQAAARKASSALSICRGCGKCYGKTGQR